MIIKYHIHVGHIVRTVYMYSIENIIDYREYSVKLDYIHSFIS